MIDYCDLLLKILPVPNMTFETGTDYQWKEFEQQLGTKLPADYKWFIDTYGTGDINDLIVLSNPFSKSVEFIKQMEAMKESYLISKDYSVIDFPHELYPAKNGLLPFAYTTIGDELFWETSGKPDSWRVIVTDDCGFEKYEYSFIELIYKILTEQINARFFSNDFIYSNNSFYPYEPNR